MLQGPPVPSAPASCLHKAALLCEVTSASLFCSSILRDGEIKLGDSIKGQALLELLLNSGTAPRAAIQLSAVGFIA